MIDYTNAEWVTVQATPGATDNYAPSLAGPLFREWVAEGWEIVSVTVFPPSSPAYMCSAVGVLRRPKRT